MCCYLSLKFVGVAVQANAAQQCLTPLERSTIHASQILVPLLDPLVGNAQFTNDVSNHLSAVLGELLHLALTLLRSDLLDFCMISDLPLPESILNFHSSAKADLPQLPCCNQAAIKTRWRNNSKLPRPYIERLINLRRLICPSTGPVLYG